IEYMPADTPPEEKDCILHDDWISALKVTEKYYITGCYDGQIYVWDKNNSLVAKEIVHKKPIKCIDVFDDGGSILIVSGSLDRTISVNRFSHGKIERVFVGIGHKNSIYSIASGCFDSTIGIWSVYDDSYNKDVITVEKKKVQAKSCVTFMEGHKDAVTQACDVAFLNIVQSPFEPHWLASGHADGIIRIWNPLDKESVLYKKLPSNSPMNFALAWKPDNQFVLCAGSYDGSVRTFDLRHPKECLFIVKSAAEDDKVFVCEFDGNDLLFGGEAKKLNIFSN
ncbi:WD40 repeat-like protein, partial [Rozella allomycis CSF55]